MPQETITCPSGLSVSIRNLKARELALLSDMRSTKNKNPVSLILSGCTLVTHDAGPYTLQAGTPLDWDKVLLCDRFHALIRMRSLTWGNEYEFKVRCPDPQCEKHRTSFVWFIPLDKLETKPLPEASREKVRNGDLTFEAKVGGVDITYRLLTGHDELRTIDISTKVSSDQSQLAAVAAKIVAVQGLELTSTTPKEEDVAIQRLVDWVSDLDLPELSDASELFDTVDGGVETTTTVSCPTCGLEFETDVPFALEAFLSKPPKVSKAVNRPRSSSPATTPTS